MTDTLRKLSLLLGSLLAMAGCGDIFQARATEPTMVVTQRIQGVIPGVPGGLVTTLPPFSFTFDMPSTPITENGASNTAGPVKVNSSIQLNQAGMAIPSGFAADFNGFDTLQLTISGNGKTQVLAKYVKDPANPRSGIGTTTGAGQFFDPWGRPYDLKMDGTYDNQLANPYSANTGAGPTPLAIGVIAWSGGKDAKAPPDSGATTTFSDSDDVISWQ